MGKIAYHKSLRSNLSSHQVYWCFDTPRHWQRSWTWCQPTDPVQKLPLLLLSSAWLRSGTYTKKWNVKLMISVIQNTLNHLHLPMQVVPIQRLLPELHVGEAVAVANRHCPSQSNQSIVDHVWGVECHMNITAVPSKMFLYSVLVCNLPFFCVHCQRKAINARLAFSFDAFP